MIPDHLKVYLAGGILILLVLAWIYLRGNENESLQDELEDDDDTRDVRDTDVAKIVDN